jgi:hypothetical protein
MPHSSQSSRPTGLRIVRCIKSDENLRVEEFDLDAKVGFVLMVTDARSALRLRGTSTLGSVPQVRTRRKPRIR